MSRTYTLEEARRARCIGNIMFALGAALAFIGIGLGGLSILPRVDLLLVVIGFITALVSFRFNLYAHLRVALLEKSRKLIEIYVENKSKKVLLKILKVYARDYTGNILAERELSTTLPPRQGEIVRLEASSGNSLANAESICIIVEGGTSICVSESERMREIEIG